MLLDRKPVLRYHLLAALILTFIMRMALPQVRYLYYPLFILLVADFLISKPNGATLKRILKPLAPYFLLLGIFLAASLYHTAYVRPYIEIVNALELAAILIIIFYYITRGMQWSSFRTIFIRQLLIISGLTAVAGLGRLAFVVMGGDLYVEEGESLVSTATDYNFFVLALLYGLVVGLYQLLSLKRPGRGKIWLYNAALFIWVAGIILVPSRRGAVILFLILVSLILIRLMVVFARRSLIMPRIRRMDYFLALVLVSVVGLGIFLFHTSHQFKEDFLIRTGLYRMDLRSRLTDTWYRYGRMVSGDLQFREAYMHLWSDGRNHKDERILIDQPFANEKGSFRRQGNSRFKILSRQQGPGCLAVRATDPDQGLTREFYVDVGDTIEVSAMIRVIKWDRHLGVAIPDRDNRNYLYARPKREWEGDGQWHPLRLRVVYDVFGSLPIWLGGGSSPDSSSFSCWSGLQVRRMNTGKKKENLHSDSPTPQNQLMPPGPHPTRHAGKNMDSENTAQEGLPVIGKSKILRHVLAEALLQELPDSQRLDSLRADLKGPFPDNRPGRWKMAGEIFGHYTFAQKLMGNGLTWLPLYGEVFYNHPRHYDYPHNPLISTVLYSGVIGGLLYLAYLIWSLALYVKNRQRYGLFLMLFLLTGVFVSVSGNSHFSVPAFAFLTQLPFFFSYLDQNKNASIE